MRAFFTLHGTGGILAVSDIVDVDGHLATKMVDWIAKDHITLLPGDVLKVEDVIEFKQEPVL